MATSTVCPLPLHVVTDVLPLTVFPPSPFPSLSSAGLDRELCRPPSAGVERDPAPPHPSSVFPSWSVSSWPPLRLNQRFSVTLTQTPEAQAPGEGVDRRRSGRRSRRRSGRQLRENRRTFFFFFFHDISGSLSRVSDGTFCSSWSGHVDTSRTSLLLLLLLLRQLNTWSWRLYFPGCFSWSSFKDETFYFTPREGISGTLPAQVTWLRQKSPDLKRRWLLPLAEAEMFRGSLAVCVCAAALENEVSMPFVFFFQRLFFFSPWRPTILWVVK